MLDAGGARAVMEAGRLRGGNEHAVALGDGDRVLKDLDAHRIATESLFDHLTDHLLACHFFGDDIALEGFYQHEGRLHMVCSQPFIKGRHPGWEELVRGMERQGWRHAAPGSRIPSFVFADDSAGEIEVIDLHENNVVAGGERVGLAASHRRAFLFCQSGGTDGCAAGAGADAWVTRGGALGRARGWCRLFPAKPGASKDRIRRRPVRRGKFARSHS